MSSTGHFLRVGAHYLSDEEKNRLQQMVVGCLGVAAALKELGSYVDLEHNHGVEMTAQRTAAVDSFDELVATVQVRPPRPGHASARPARSLLRVCWLAAIAAGRLPGWIGAAGAGHCAGPGPAAALQRPPHRCAPARYNPVPCGSLCCEDASL